LLALLTYFLIRTILNKENYMFVLQLKELKSSN
jgi:hypothetical protein